MRSCLKVGDVVQLMSGGPKMTVTSIGETAASCKWFVGDEVQDGRFGIKTLKRADPCEG